MSVLFGVTVLVFFLALSLSWLLGCNHKWKVLAERKEGNKVVRMHTCEKCGNLKETRGSV